MKALTIVFAILVTTAWEQQEVQPTMEQAIPYRLLKACIPRGILSNVDCAVSVDSFLDRQQIAKLICEVIQKEKPAPSSMFNLTIYYKLDEVFATGLSPTLEEKLNSYIIAQYAWNKEIPGVRKRLWISRDSQGNPLHPLEAYEFDHTKLCK